MQYTVYIDDQTSRQLSEAALKRGANRNAIILQALQEWLAAQKAAEALDQSSTRQKSGGEQLMSASYY
ncbi:CopG family transcriptional regulator [Aquabacterium soli]|jgi:predicted transcriptional regulator|uniref:CopG family transcriptional regulator n=1 Tax=Aquabacterium soli TaxID=2493092 RepID=A0A3R8S585_9BURK|nr:ribbon-helix-helix domain-containing protein [Aquabacterium soli]RRS05781.1 CopG family transcriptional regulator [Aquabacterium soli]